MEQGRGDEFLFHRFIYLFELLFLSMTNISIGFNKMKILIFFFFYLSIGNSFAQQLIHIKHFGKNKGHLKMYVHLPANIDKDKPLPMVVVLHGCLQCANSVSKQTGWSKLGDDNKFYVLYPQQRGVNNPMRCFKFYKRKHTNKNRGENYSIEQMIEYMKSNYSINDKQIYITGLSAGAAMSVTMMADYPETFNSGAIFAGGAYKMGNGYIAAMTGMLGWRVKSADKWGDMVRKQNPDYKGKYPRIIIYQGNNDLVVNRRNGNELMKQWTNLYNVSTQPTETVKGFAGVNDIERNVYRDANNTDAVILYKVNKLGHELLIDPGKCPLQGGRKGLFSKDKNYNSTLWTAYDFGLISTPIINGKTEVERQEQNVTYTVPLTNNCKYEWSFPDNCKVVKNDKSNTITLNWGDTSGTINVTENDSSFCKKQFKTLFVTVK